MGCGAVEARAGMELVAFQDQEAEVVVVYVKRSRG